MSIGVHMPETEGRLPSTRMAGGRPRRDYDDVVLNEVQSDPRISVSANESLMHEDLSQYQFKVNIKCRKH